MNAVRADTSAVVAAVAITTALMLAGCGEARAPRAPTALPPAWSPGDFPDIPLPLGFIADPIADQLAVVLGEGVRRFDVTLVFSGQGGPAVEALRADVRRGLQAWGWTPVADGSFTKGDERLTVEAGRNDGTARLRIRLLPPPAAAP